MLSESLEVQIKRVRLYSIDTAIVYSILQDHPFFGGLLLIGLSGVRKEGGSVAVLLRSTHRSCGQSI